MGDWVDKQMRISDPHATNKLEEIENSPDRGSPPVVNEDGNVSIEKPATLSEVSNEAVDTLSIEQRRAYKLELQVRNCIYVFCSCNYSD